MSTRTDVARIPYPGATVFTRELAGAIEALTEEDFEILRRQEFRPLHEELFTPVRVSQRREREIMDDANISDPYELAMQGVDRMYDVFEPVSAAHFRGCMAAGHWD